jgi:hypothetical protein
MLAPVPPPNVPQASQNLEQLGEVSDRAAELADNRCVIS